MTANSTNVLATIDAQKYNLDKTGISDTSASFQKMIDSYPKGSTINLPKGIYKISDIVNLKDGMSLIAGSDVVIAGTGKNTLFTTGNDNTFKGIEFQNCSIALRVLYVKGINITNCRFTNNITYAAIDIYGSSDCTITNSYFYNINKYGIKIDNNSSNITIDKNYFDNPKVFGGYTDSQISGHVYCLSGSKINVTNNILKNSGGQGIIFGYSSTLGKGTTNCIARNNTCTGNGQEGITIYGGVKKLSSGNSIIGNTSKNNRYNQIEVWQSDNNTISGNTVEESIAGRGNLGAICLFTTTGTTVTENTVLSAQNNGIDITAGSLYSTITNNSIANTNLNNNITAPQKGNAILLDSAGISQPQYTTIRNNKISSSIGIIPKSGIYSTSNSNKYNKIDSNSIIGYKSGFHSYAKMTCGM
ncbi:MULTISPECIES: right-handed parallel beta-helix repeat-containing protein [Clostridium]|uniref:Right-handed parallel beta-helix repeat-containing protein n=1 Tax=Clostridium frigoriphilum TaxID=443253 RepID=A0ABU7UL76_9CLOT|nr:right-handed parallel beta-helix repeat-containing protein [Clostridium sp. DSM 17811]